MTDAVVSFLLEKLGSPLIEEALLQSGLRDEIDELRSDLRWMQCFLKDADARRRKGNELAKNWVREVRELAHRAEDIVDTFALSIDARCHNPSAGFIHRVVSLAAAFPSELIARHNLVDEIRNLKATTDRISANRERYGLVDLNNSSNSDADSDHALHARRRISPHLDEDTVVVGFEAHKEEIVRRLLDRRDLKRQRRCVLSIVGTGGIGKTTLAKKVYNSPEIRAGFSNCSCISVSHGYKVAELVRAIAKEVMITAGNQSESENADKINRLEQMEVEDLKKSLNNFLKERTYFIVLDDVWSIDVWNQIQPVLPDAMNGNRVLITTRSMDLARSADPGGFPPYQLPFLNEDESWELFLKKAFPYVNLDVAVETVRCQQGLERIGRHLVRRCGGLPLALVVLGGLVSRKGPNPAAWGRVSQRLDWGSPNDGGDCLKILGLSYDDLPHHHLRSCFLYLGLFPEDCQIWARQLIKLWIAEGFVPEAGDNKAMEDTAETYLEELAQRSLIQVAEEDPLDGSIVRFQIHDLFRDLCIREASEDGFFSIYDPSKSINHYQACRRLAVHSLTTEDLKNCCPPSTLRSLLVFRAPGVTNADILSGLKLLRVAHLEEIQSIMRLQKAMAGMIHLRYLNLPLCYELTELPPAVEKLGNLQTLEISNTGIKKLPMKALGALKALRHMYLPPSCECPPSIGNLINLQTLINASARGGWIEHGLGGLVNIRDFEVSGLEAKQDEAFIGSIKKMERLSSLVLTEAELVSMELITSLSNHEHLRRLQFQGPMSPRRLPGVDALPGNLTKLVLEGSRLVDDPMPVLEKLTNLVVLELHTDAYIGNEMNCTAGGFPRLQDLVFNQLMEGFRDWNVEASAMPSLATLRIHDCLRLARLPDGLQHVTSLRYLSVFDGREEFRRRLQPDTGVEWYKIRHVPSVKIHSVKVRPM